LETELEFTTRMRGSEFKIALDALPLGAEVELEGPYGAFTLPDGLKQVVFIAGGIGITCVRSMLRWLSDRQDAPEGVPRAIVLLFANHSEDTIPFHDELEELETRLHGFRVIQVISQPGKDWRVYRGHIDREVLDRELPWPTSWAYYLSGPPSFVHSMQELLISRGIESGSIKTEGFEGYE
jgi:ferredoxin-NADP reductase